MDRTRDFTQLGAESCTSALSVAKTGIQPVPAMKRNAAAGSNACVAATAKAPPP